MVKIGDYIKSLIVKCSPNALHPYMSDDVKTFTHHSCTLANTASLSFKIEILYFP